MYRKPTPNKQLQNNAPDYHGDKKCVVAESQKSTFISPQGIINLTIKPIGKTFNLH